MIKRNKYGNVKVEVDGITFDSKIEAKYYEQLKWLEANKQILFFRLQPRYLLQDGFTKNDVKHRSIEYVADFEIHNLDGSIEVIDCKGVETDVFKLKRKLFENKFPHKLSILKYVKKYGGWITIDEWKKLKRVSK